jgi:hypothetical protein
MNTQTGEGLCAGCMLAAGCTFPGESDEPILSCGTFDSLAGSARKNAKDACEVNQRDPSRIDGLCGDCGNRESCVFRQREGGTWHCEEYS